MTTPRVVRAMILLLVTIPRKGRVNRVRMVDDEATFALDLIELPFGCEEVEMVRARDEERDLYAKTSQVR